MNRFNVFNEEEKDVIRMALRRFYDQVSMEQHENQTDLELNTSILYYELMESIKKTKSLTIMKKGFKFNYILKVALSNRKFVSKNFMNYERAKQEWLYYKNCTDARIGIIFRADNSIAASFGIE